MGCLDGGMGRCLGGVGDGGIDFTREADWLVEQPGDTYADGILVCEMGCMARGAWDSAA